MPLPSPPISSDTPPSGPGRLHAGQHRLLWLDEGTELRCLHGTLRLRPAGSVLDEPAPLGERELHAPRAWRSPRGQWVRLAAAAQPCAYRLDAAPAPATAPLAGMAGSPKRNHPEPRGAGWLEGFAAGRLRRVAACLRRALRAA